VEKFYKLKCRAIDGQDLELLGIKVHVQELNQLVLFRCPENTTDQEIEELRGLLTEAFIHEDPSKIIVARGGFDLRLEAIEEGRPSTPQDVAYWLSGKISEYQRELRELEALLGRDQGMRLMETGTIIDTSTFVSYHAHSTTAVKPADVNVVYQSDDQGVSLLLTDNKSGFEVTIPPHDLMIKSINQMTDGEIRQALAARLSYEMDRNFNQGYKWKEGGMLMGIDNRNGNVLSYSNDGSITAVNDPRDIIRRVGIA
jgi:hypothetical protein